MSAPITINRPTSPWSSSDTSSTSSFGSNSSTSSALVYTREELLALATSPLAWQGHTPKDLRAFPQIMRQRRRGLLEAYQTFEYERTTNLTDASSKDSDGCYRSDDGGDGRVDVYIPPARRRMEQPMRHSVGKELKVPS